jgi:hypothetical protein
MAMHNPSHPGEFIIQVYLEPNSLSGRELAGKLGVAASTLNRILTGSSRISPENGTTPVQGAWPFAGELAGHAVQPRSLACQAACEARPGREGPAHSGLEESGRRLKGETRGRPKRVDRSTKLHSDP